MQANGGIFIFKNRIFYFIFISLFFIACAELRQVCRHDKITALKTSPPYAQNGSALKHENQKVEKNNIPKKKSDDQKKLVLSSQANKKITKNSKKSNSFEKEPLFIKQVKKEEAVSLNPLGIAFFKPNYIMPFYYTGSTYESIYEGQTPDKQTLDNAEFKAQLSLQVPIWKNIFVPGASINLAYTQLFYWQIYAQSQYFRETNYEPELFISYYFAQNWLTRLSVVHQSNGRGGEMERSWNRVYAEFDYSYENLLISVKPWLLIFKNESSDLHNPNITDYLGHGRILFAYKNEPFTFSLMLRNIFESSFSRGAVEFGWRFTIYGRLKGYIQYFGGYGQSLIEYDHYTNSAGIGIALSDWL